MQIRVDRLREALRLLQPVIPGKTPLPVLKNILLKDGQAIATDMETMIVLGYPELDGECLIPHRPVLELMKYVPGNELLTIEKLKKSIKLSWEGGKASYDAADPEDFPLVPEVKEKARGSVDGDRLVPALKSVVGYCADGERPVLTGVSLSLGETIEAAAGDGFRMAYQILPISFPVEEKVIIPAHSILVLAKLWDKIPPTVPLKDSLVNQVLSKRQLELTLGDKLMARFGRVTLFSNPIEGSAPNFGKLIPQEPPLKVRVFAPEFERAVRRCAEIASDGSGTIRLSWTETALTISAKEEEKGSVEAKIPVQTEGGTGKIAVNVKYLLGYLNGKEGLVTICAKGAQDPLLFRHGTSPLVVIMPKFVKW
ncbi:Beta sliding clamp [subsurface metagenome]